MILDAQLVFSDAQAVTAAAGSDSTIDTGVAGGRGLGVGEDIYLVVSVQTTLGDGGSNTSTAVALEGDSTESFTPDGTNTLFSFPQAAPAGTTRIAKLAPHMLALAYRYLRLKYTPAGADLTSGKFDAFLTKDISAYASYADAITIS
jgi:hypothetical protein